MSASGRTVERMGLGTPIGAASSSSLASTRRSPAFTFLCLASLLATLLLGSCSQAGSVRHGPGGQCRSDRDCFYGLVCRAPEGGAANACVLETYGPCEDDDDCFSGRRCLESECVVQCITARDCPESRPVCLVGACEASDRLRCVTHGDCGVGEECVGGRCLMRLGGGCSSDFDCPPATRCIAGRCR